MSAATSDPKAIFFAALDQPSPTERLRYLDAACGSDPEVRSRVEQLLAAHDQAGQFLGGPAPVTVDHPQNERPGAQIGPYKLLQQIGEGGMGVVYMAEQTEPIARRVALKIIKPGMDSRQVIARFEAERQALALMDHVNIARVLDAGTTPAGRPYFVMELVNGMPITKYCDDNRLTPRQRLELFVPVCQAIQHAHQKGIIHRDIKPTNVMITLYDGQPVAKVIDFGVAKATEQKLTERTLFTQYGTLVGTLEYMSPEQAEMSALGVDTRSDIYSLGVLLYELLTGSTPLSNKRMKEAAYGEILRMIKEEEPPKPSTRLSESGEHLASISAQRHTEPAKLSKLVRGELDWIVMKTLEKDRNRRYETANSFADDVQRYLHDEPVHACPPSGWYRFRKFARRNKAALITVLVVVAALVTGTAVATWQAVRATRATAAVLVETQRADEQAEVATGTTKYLQQMLGSLEPGAGKGLDYSVRQLLDDYVGDLEKQLPNHPEVEATLQATLGRGYACLGERDKARKHLARALTLRRGAFGPRHEKYADSLVDYARPDVWQSSEYAQREIELRQALATYRERGVEGQRVIYALWTLQWLLVEQAWAGVPGKWNEIEPVWEEAVAEARKSPGVEIREIGYIQSGLVQAKIAQAKYSEAEQLARESLAMRLRLNGPEHLQTAWGYHVLSETLRAQHKFREALQAQRQALTIMRKALPSGHINTATALTAVIRTLESADNSHALDDQVSLADLSQWESAFRDVIATTKPAQLGSNDPVVVAVWGLAKCSDVYVDLANELAAAGKSDEADECRQKAILVLEELEELQSQFSGNPSLLAYVYGYGTLAMTNAGRPEQTHALARKLLEPTTRTTSYWQNIVAWHLATAEVTTQRDPALAVELAEKAVQFDPQSHHYYNTLGVARYRTGAWKHAISDLEHAASLGKGGNSHDWFFLAMAHWQLDQKAEARRRYDQAVVWMEKNDNGNADLRRFRAEADELMKKERSDREQETETK